MPEALTDDLVPTGGQLAYAGAQLRNALHSTVLRAFRDAGISEADLAWRLGTEESTVRNWLGGCGDWSIDRAARLLFAINGAFFSVGIDRRVAMPKSDTRRRNDSSHMAVPGEPTPARSYFR